MIQKDYILRLLADLAEALARLLKIQQPHQAFDEMTRTLESVYKMTLDEFLNLPDNELQQPDWPASSGIADSMGEFLNTAADIAHQHHRHDIAENLKLKALHLLSEAEAQSSTYSFNRMVIINRIKEELGI
ncbi:hypothetical protein LX69_00428 [Breznakibacter xylanolyticus]|uniref:Uncharacterized protein n=1 Tax=Breznakibacter xylanolyticus TaxID=990 RepID=A0A2W7QET2_9BACT|nr:hypothetical protein [Breznakibacter xylanolyticus]PZX20429.1 hypothetical protein LX69_00428 [Breznakibacter xylanolyticus]